MSYTWGLGGDSNDVGSDIVYSESRGIFVMAVQTGGNTSIRTSSNGHTWVEVGSLTGVGIFYIEYSPTLDIFVASDGNSAWSSTDLVTWTPASFGGSTTNVQQLVWDSANSQFLAISFSSGDGISTSADGLSWTAHAGPYTDDSADGNFGVVCVGLSTLVLFMTDASNVGPDGAVVSSFVSTDGITWTLLGDATATVCWSIDTAVIRAQNSAYYVAGQRYGAALGGALWDSGVFVFNGSTWTTFTPVFTSNTNFNTPPETQLGTPVVKTSDLADTYIVAKADTTGDVLYVSTDNATYTTESTGVSGYQWFKVAYNAARTKIVWMNTTTPPA